MEPLIMQLSPACIEMKEKEIRRKKRRNKERENKKRGRMREDGRKTCLLHICCFLIRVKN
jgi:hypothetical protein